MSTRRRYTCGELAALVLPGYPTTAQGWRLLVEREQWLCCEAPARGGHGGVRREYLPPAELAPVIAQRELQLQVIGAQPAPTSTALPAVLHATPVELALPSASLTDRQRLERDARTGVLAALARLQQAAGCKQDAAITTLLTTARAGGVVPELDRMLRLARDPRGRPGDGYPSERTLKRWIAAGDLVPRIPQASTDVPPWAAAFLRIWQVPQKVSVSWAHRQLLQQLPAGIDGPSVYQVYRFVDRLGAVTRERGRMGDRELKNIRPFVRRSFDELLPCDVWTADGHTFDGEVQHPLHGRPFRPELTLIIDIGTRFAPGWSAGLAESTWTVADALRYAATRFGAPAIFYVDNGSGFKNRTLSDDDLGILGRLGASIEHSLPYNSQARGVIERAHQTVWVEGARTLPSYMGAAMDREARLQHFKLTRRAVKRGTATPLMPWHLFLQWCEERVAEYNNRPHASLGGITPAAAWANHVARGWQAEPLGDADQMNTLFRPREARTVRRGEIELFGNRYFSRELEEFHGSQLHVGYDIHDPAHIWIYTPEGRYVCTAEVDGNRRHYFPVAVVQQAREKRATARLRRVADKRDEILAELHGAPALSAPEPLTGIVIGSRVMQREDLLAARQAKAVQAEETAAPAAPRRPELVIDATPAPASAAPLLPRSQRAPADNYREWCELDARIKAGEAVPDGDAEWHERYQLSAQFRALNKKQASA